MLQFLFHSTWKLPKQFLFLLWQLRKYAFNLKKCILWTKKIEEKNPLKRKYVNSLKTELEVKRDLFQTYL